MKNTITILAVLFVLYLIFKPKQSEAKKFTGAVLINGKYYIPGTYSYNQAQKESQQSPV